MGRRRTVLYPCCGRLVSLPGLSYVFAVARGRAVVQRPFVDVCRKCGQEYAAGSAMPVLTRVRVISRQGLVVRFDDG